mmetsp:Transcript_76185/g.150671  ORF Transcript_76185/g.150671 Transcript_76185/m.150671 type:complete len:174 (+) Transcript_76185:102-623(+)
MSVCKLTISVVLLAHMAHGVRVDANTTSTEECSCWKGLKPGLGIPLVGSLSCVAPLSCKEKCSAQMQEPCVFRALCTLSEGDGEHHCDCSMCKGPTQKHIEYQEHCKADSCPTNQACYWNGCKFSEDGGSVCQSGEGLQCECEYPRAWNSAGVCVDCKKVAYNHTNDEFECED